MATNHRLYGDIWCASGTEADGRPIGLIVVPIPTGTQIEILDLEITTAEASAANQFMGIDNAVHTAVALTATSIAWVGTAVTAIGGDFVNEVSVGDLIRRDDEADPTAALTEVATVTDANNIVLTEAYNGTDGAGDGEQMIQNVEEGTPRQLLKLFMSRVHPIRKSYGKAHRGERPEQNGMKLTPGAGLATFAYSILYRKLN